MESTYVEYDNAVESCKKIFLRKTEDYGTSWRVLRNISIVDQIFIKAQRIRNIQQNQVRKVDDDIPYEFQGIVNYAIIGLIQIELDNESVEDMPIGIVELLFDHKITQARSVMADKNHDYGEAWRDMSQESFVDLILMKLLRVKQIITNDGRTLVSEGIDANFIDIVNYSIFALIQIEAGKHRK
ncbi:MAG TPA: DUF1599 domain-containing protein [Puia sp.]|nr:DUF1599 domain-containing protein [Puia sp.]